MSRRKQSKVSSRKNKRRRELARRKNRTALFELLKWFVLGGELFGNEEFHGNTKWKAEPLAVQAVIWSWQETKNVTDAFDQTLEVCGDLGLKNTAMTYTSFMYALDRYDDVFGPRLREQCQLLAEEVGRRYFRTNGWVLMGFDGSRATAPRTVSNERAFCASNYGSGKRAKYGKKNPKACDANATSRTNRNRKHPKLGSP